MTPPVTLPVQPLSAESFAPFGRVIDLPERSRDAEGPGWRWWAETVLLDGDDRAWGVGYLDLVPSGATFDWAERHLRTLEVILPVAGSCLVYVASAKDSVESDGLPPLDRFAVFRVEPGSGVVMDRGVWHGAPLAADAPSRAVVLIQEGTGLDDVDKVEFSETPVLIDHAGPT